MRPLRLGVAAALAVACARGAWDVSQFEARHPSLRALGSHRLGDTHPYLLPLRGTLTFFLCRWPGDRPIPVSLPPDAGPGERRVLERALQAWQGAGLGVDFALGAPPGTGIEIRFAGDPAAEQTLHTATTVADCGVESAALESAPRGRLPARLVFASIHLRRHERDVLGRPVALSEEQLQASALHEIGHALGFQGHARRGRTVMVRSVDSVLRVGRRVAAGEPLRDETLRALYAVPSGAVVARARVAEARTAPVDHMLALAGPKGLAGPLARVGGREAQLAWRDERGRPYALLSPELPGVLRRPESLVVQPQRRAALLLAGEEIRF